MLYSKLVFVLGFSLGLVGAQHEHKMGGGADIFDENDLEHHDEELAARMAERREYLSSRREEARAARRSERRGRDGDLPTDDVFADREAYLAEKRAEMARRHQDLDLGDMMPNRDGDIPGLDRLHEHHHETRKRMEEDMAERHNDMLLRRAERYRSRAERSSLSSEDKALVDQLIEEYVTKEKDMMDSRMKAKSDRMRPAGDMRDPAVKEQFKADLRKSIDERKEKDRVMRDEVRDLRHRLEDMLSAHPGADL